ncbi:MAG: TIGR03084 family metal-binding protein [bacterium]|nr:TIGR03084 family metal-binding protein [bacterium]
MLPIAQDFRDEVADLHAFYSTIEAADWERETRFMDWTPWDVVAHLHFFDDVSLHCTHGEEGFAPKRKELNGMMGSGKSMKELQREALGHLSADALLAKWRETAFALADELGELDPKARLPWFGPDMGASMFTTARFMETWAHAQAIYDLVGAERTHTDRIRNIVAIGYRTFGWTFVNRKLDPPGSPPLLRLTAPSGALWEYGDPAEASPGETIEGTALDFCLTVTQVRNVKDTALDVQGDVANAWMEIAQCFAGPPVDPPPPGHRVSG